MATTSDDDVVRLDEGPATVQGQSFGILDLLKEEKAAYKSALSSIGQATDEELMRMEVEESGIRRRESPEVHDVGNESGLQRNCRRGSSSNDQVSEGVSKLEDDLVIVNDSHENGEGNVLENSTVDQVVGKYIKHDGETGECGNSLRIDGDKIERVHRPPVEVRSVRIPRKKLKELKHRKPDGKDGKRKEPGRGKGSKVKDAVQIRTGVEESSQSGEPKSVEKGHPRIHGSRVSESAVVREGVPLVTEEKEEKEDNSHMRWTREGAVDYLKKEVCDCFSDVVGGMGSEITLSDEECTEMATQLFDCTCVPMDNEVFTFDVHVVNDHLKQIASAFLRDSMEMGNRDVKDEDVVEVESGKQMNESASIEEKYVVHQNSQEEEHCNALGSPSTVSVLSVTEVEPNMRSEDVAESDPPLEVDPDEGCVYNAEVGDTSLATKDDTEATTDGVENGESQTAMEVHEHLIEKIEPSPPEAVPSMHKEVHPKQVKRVTVIANGKKKAKSKKGNVSKVAIENPDGNDVPVRDVHLNNVEVLEKHSEIFNEMRTYLQKMSDTQQKEQETRLGAQQELYERNLRAFDDIMKKHEDGISQLFHKTNTGEREIDENEDQAENADDSASELVYSLKKVANIRATEEDTNFRNTALKTLEDKKERLASFVNDVHRLEDDIQGLEESVSEKLRAATERERRIYETFSNTFEEQLREIRTERIIALGSTEIKSEFPVDLCASVGDIEKQYQTSANCVSAMLGDVSVDYEPFRSVKSIDVSVPRFRVPRLEELQIPLEVDSEVPKRRKDKKQHMGDTSSVLSGLPESSLQKLMALASTLRKNDLAKETCIKSSADVPEATSKKQGQVGGSEPVKDHVENDVPTVSVGIENREAENSESMTDADVIVDAIRKDNTPNLVSEFVDELPAVEDTRDVTDDDFADSEPCIGVKVDSPTENKIVISDEPLGTDVTKDDIPETDTETVPSPVIMSGQSGDIDDVEQAVAPSAAAEPKESDVRAVHEEKDVIMSDVQGIMNDVSDALFSFGVHELACPFRTTSVGSRVGVVEEDQASLHRTFPSVLTPQCLLTFLGNGMPVDDDLLFRIVSDLLFENGCSRDVDHKTHTSVGSTTLSQMLPENLSEEDLMFNVILGSLLRETPFGSGTIYPSASTRNDPVPSRTADNRDSADEDYTVEQAPVIVEREKPKGISLEKEALVKLGPLTSPVFLHVTDSGCTLLPAEMVRIVSSDGNETRSKDVEDASVSETTESKFVPEDEADMKTDDHDHTVDGVRELVEKSSESDIINSRVAAESTEPQVMDQVDVVGSVTEGSVSDEPTFSQDVAVSDRDQKDNPSSEIESDPTIPPLPTEIKEKEIAETAVQTDSYDLMESKVDAPCVVKNVVERKDEKEVDQADKAVETEHPVAANQFVQVECDGVEEWIRRTSRSCSENSHSLGERFEIQSNICVENKKSDISYGEIADGDISDGEVLRTSTASVDNGCDDSLSDGQYAEFRGTESSSESDAFSFLKHIQRDIISPGLVLHETEDDIPESVSDGEQSRVDHPTNIYTSPQKLQPSSRVVNELTEKSGLERSTHALTFAEMCSIRDRNIADILRSSAQSDVFRGINYVEGIYMFGTTDNVGSDILSDDD